MKLNLNKNIQSYRKQKGMTQEQLAEAMGVTVGAVSKWENGLSNPDLSIIAELADFFEVSVDVLLGYQLTIGSMRHVAEKIKKLDKEKRYEEAHTESLKALQKYPNRFDVVYTSGIMEFSRGLEEKNQEAVRASIKLLERADQLISQNDDERISSMEIEIRIAKSYWILGEYEEALTRLKKVNPDGMNDDTIANVYVSMERYDDALEYLSQAFENAFFKLYNICFQLSNCYINTKKEELAAETAVWMRESVFRLSKGIKVNYTSKLLAYLDSMLAIAALKKENIEQAKLYLRSAIQYVETFDQNREYTFQTPFTKSTGQVMCDDAGNGDTYFQYIMEQCKDEPELYESFSGLYRELKEEEKE